jgi:cell division protein ZapA
MIENRPEAAPPPPSEPDPEATRRTEALASRLESLADALERQAANP